MRKTFLLLPLIGLMAVLYSCSSSETVTYDAGNNESWKIDVIHKTAATDKYFVNINDSTVIEKTVNVLTGKLEETGVYRGKEIKLVVEYKKDEYLISGSFEASVFVDNKLAAKFNK